MFIIDVDVIGVDVIWYDQYQFLKLVTIPAVMINKSIKRTGRTMFKRMSAQRFLFSLSDLHTQHTKFIFSKTYFVLLALLVS